MISDDEAKTLALFESVIATSFEAEVDRRFGEPGVFALLRVLGLAREFFRYMPPEYMVGGVTLVVPVEPGDIVRLADGERTVASLAELAGRVSSQMLVGAGPGQSLVVSERADSWSTSGPAIAYRYVHGIAEEVIVDGEAWGVPETGWPCAMAVPVFNSLEGALDRYVAVTRRPEYCEHLAKVWRDKKRLAFLPRPEKHMRRSLFLALRYALTNAHVEQEQNQDETKPVDIEVQWWNPGRTALIEVKWLGKSGPEGGPFTTPYKERRAIDGLVQLADYLDRRHGTTPEVSLIGYLFVFDARRKDLRHDDTALDSDRAGHFRDLDPRYPDELLARPDMGRPFRVFIEPAL